MFSIYYKYRKKFKKKGVLIMFSKEKMIWFSELKVVDLKAELKKRGFRGYSKMKKAELKEALLNLMEEEEREEVKQDTSDKDSDDTINLDDLDEKQRKEWEEMQEEFARAEAEDEEAMKTFVNGIYRDNIVIPRVGYEDKIKRLLRDASKIYHPDKSTGDPDMMIFINMIRDNLRK